MSLSRVGGSSVAATSVTIPAHVAGDIIVIWAFRDGSTTPPTVPTAGGTVPTFTTIDGPTGANSCSAVCAYAVAAGTTDTSGTWTNATGISVEVWRGAAASPIGGHAQNGSSVSSGGNLAMPAITQSDASGSAVILAFAGWQTVTAWSAAPSGYTQQSQVATECEALTKDSTTSDGAFNVSGTASGAGGTRRQQVELIAGLGNRVTQQVTEVLGAGTTKARVTQQVTEVLSAVPALGNRVTQQVLEVLVRIPKRFTVSFSGVGTFVPNLFGYQRIHPTFSGVGTFLATIRGKIAIHPTFAGHGTLTAVLAGYQRFTTTFAGHGTFSVLVPSKKALAVTFHGIGTFVPNLFGYQRVTPTFAGHSSFGVTLSTSSGVTHNLTPTFHGVGTFRAILRIQVPLNPTEGNLWLLGDSPTMIPYQPDSSGVIDLAADAPKVVSGLKAIGGTMTLRADPANLPVATSVTSGVLKLLADAAALPSSLKTTGGATRLKGDNITYISPESSTSGVLKLVAGQPTSLPLSTKSGVLRLVAQQPKLWLFNPTGGLLRLRGDNPAMVDYGFTVRSGVLLLLSKPPVVTPLTEPTDGGGPSGHGIHIRDTV